MHAVNMKGTLLNSTPVVLNVSNVDAPMTITLESSYASRKIELSTNGGAEYFTPTPTVTSSTMQVVTVAYPITTVRITGQNADVWGIL